MKFAVNIVSLMHTGLQWAGFPGCFFTQPQHLIDAALAIGYDGVQMLPIRGATGMEEGVLLWERAWNPVDNLVQALTHQLGAAGMASCINDWVVSPSSRCCQKVEDLLSGRNDLTQVAHDFGSRVNSLVELHPELVLGPSEIVEKIQSRHRKGLVVDTYHLRRENRYGEVNSLLVDGHWEPVIDALAPYIRVVHIHPNNLTSFLAEPLESVEAEIIRHLKQAGANLSNTIWVAEYEPPKIALVDKTTSLSIAREFLGVMHEIASSL